jgi:hypothetical protein
MARGDDDDDGGERRSPAEPPPPPQVYSTHHADLTRDGEYERVTITLPLADVVQRGRDDQVPVQLAAAVSGGGSPKALQPAVRVISPLIILSASHHHYHHHHHHLAITTIITITTTMHQVRVKIAFAAAAEAVEAVAAWKHDDTDAGYVKSAF